MSSPHGAENQDPEPDQTDPSDRTDASGKVNLKTGISFDACKPDVGAA